MAIADNEKLASLLRALTHPARLGILELLERSPAAPIDYVRTNTEDLARISYHFRQLRSAGLIEVSSQEQRRGALKSTYRLTDRGRRMHQLIKRL